MSDELIKIERSNKEVRITSVDLVEIINQFRQEEFNILKEKGLNKKDKYTELRHNDFMTKIRKELEVLKILGLNNERNISLVEYTDKKGEKRPCYSLNRDGMLQILNSESSIVRAKTIQYIDKLETENKQLKENINMKAMLLYDIYNGGTEGVIASKKLAELEVKQAIKPLNDKIEEQTPFVQICKERLDKGEKISITDITKSLNLKRGQLTNFLKINGYIHKTLTEVNEKGKDLFKVYKEGQFNCIGILEKGVNFISDHLEEIKQAPTRMSKK